MDKVQEQQFILPGETVSGSTQTHPHPRRAPAITNFRHQMAVSIHYRIPHHQSITFRCSLFHAFHFEKWVSCTLESILLRLHSSLPGLYWAKIKSQPNRFTYHRGQFGYQTLQHSALHIKHMNSLTSHQGRFFSFFL